MTKEVPILVLTRPEAASRRFLAELEPNVEIKPIISPLIEIVRLPFVKNSETPAALVLTSEHGVAAAGRMAFPSGMQAYCVGERTASAARAQGFAPESADGDADDLVALILARGGPAPLLHLRGEHARGDIAPRLTAAGLPCAELIVYRQNDMPLTDEAMTALQGTSSVVLPLFSPRTVSILALQGPFAAPLHLIAISHAAADEAAALRPSTLEIARRPDAASMRSAVLARLQACAGPGAA
jgi:uroporphyrinogen-III synthase